ncbi:LapA family protein [Kangiella taiwanensis]|uniref:Lipopolysaccharide assembly protein A domain-containing protein n=1 Tax=Kangiella taiwanensis TaxID=1079179 RepID=A0ABP8I193_9GAMM|nr:LapA family protein [Kangiella taiwanensis]
MRKIIAIILFVVVLVISTVFALNNDQAITVNYLFGTTELALSLVVFWSGLCGLVLGILGMLFAVYKYRHRFSRTKKKLEKAEKELQQLRQQSIAAKDPF